MQEDTHETFFARLCWLLRPSWIFTSVKFHISRLFSQGSGEASSDAINSLMTYRNGSVIFVSEYISRMLAEHDSFLFITSATRALPDNGSWQGWAAVMELLYCPKQASNGNFRLILKSFDAKNREQPLFEFKISVNGFRKYQALDKIHTATALPANYSADKIFYVPQQWYYRAVDAVYVQYDRVGDHFRPHLFFLQCNVARRHNYLLQACAKFIQRLFPLGDRTLFHSIRGGIRSLLIVKIIIIINNS
jgi:hypothetical protein